MKEPVAQNGSASTFSLKKLFAITAVYAVASLLWRVSPLHGAVGLIAASLLCAAILLAQRKDHAPLAIKFILTLVFAIVAAVVSEFTLLAPGPNKGISLLFFFVAMAAGGVLGWSVAQLISRRGRAPASRKTKWAAAASAATLLTILLSVPLWPYLRQFSGRAQNLRKAEAFTPTLSARLADNPAFALIAAFPDEGHGGSILVYGHLANTEELEALKTIVADSNPPVAIVYDVTLDRYAEEYRNRRRSDEDSKIPDNSGDADPGN